MMYLDRETMNDWRARQASYGTRLLKLDRGDTMNRSSRPTDETVLAGPAIVELVVYRDGGWSARPLPFETAESIMWSTL